MSAKKNFIYNSTYQILALLIPLVTTPYLTRTLGAEGLGDYSYYFSIAQYFVMFIKMGLDNYGNRTIASVRDNKEVLSRSFWGIYIMQLFFSAFAVVIYICFSLVLSAYVTLSLLMGIYVLSGVLDITWFFWGVEEFKITVTRNIIVKVLSTILIFVFVRTSDDVLIYTIIMTGSFLINQILLWPFIIGRVDKCKIRINDVIRNIKPNLILFIPVIAVSLYTIMDKIMLGYISGSAEVGYYDSSEKVIKIPMALITSLGTVMLPRMSNLYAKDQEQIANSMITKSIDIAMLLSTSIGFGIMSVSRLFVPLYYGDGFSACIDLFTILLPSCIFVAFANVIRTQYLIPNNREIVYIVSVISGAIINLGFNSILIPKHGAIGASFATLVAEAAVWGIQIFLVRKELPIGKYLLQSIKYIVAGLIMFLVVVHVHISSFTPVMNILIQVIIGVALYTFLILGYVCLLKKDYWLKDYLIRVLKKLSKKG